MRLLTISILCYLEFLSEIISMSKVNQFDTLFLCYYRHSAYNWRYIETYLLNFSPPNKVYQDLKVAFFVLFNLIAKIFDKFLN